MSGNNSHIIQQAQTAKLKSEQARLDRASSNAGAGSETPEKLEKAAQKFEAIFMKKVFNKMREASAFSNDREYATKIHQERFTNHVSKKAAKDGGMGLADLIIDDWTKKTDQSSQTDKTSAELNPLPERSTTATNESFEQALPKSFQSPVSGNISSEWGYREHPVTGDVAFHDGTDIAAPKGQTIEAANAGRVTFAGHQDGYGKTIEIEHPGGWKTKYAHADNIDVEKGDWVEQGRKIGEVGETGRTTGPHLHFELSKGGRNFDPGQLIMLQNNGQ